MKIKAFQVIIIARKALRTKAQPLKPGNQGRTASKESKSEPKFSDPENWWRKPKNY